MRTGGGSLAVVLALLAAWAPAAQASVLLPTSRPADPAGRITALASFPTAAAVSPDGATVLAIAGPPIQGGVNGTLVSLYAIDAATGVVRQVITVTDAYGSVVFSGDGTRAFVSGGSEGVVHVLKAGPAGTFSKGSDLPAHGLVTGLALSPDGKSLWVGEPEDGQVQQIDLAARSVVRTIKAPNPNQLAVSRSGDAVYATDWRGHAISSINPASGQVTHIEVGEHPTGVAVTPDGRVLVADANDATLATIAPGAGRASLTALRMLTRRSDAPNAVAVAPDGSRAYVSLGADNAVAVLEPQGQGWRVAGLIPTGWYPDALALSPDGKTLDVVTARGLARSAAATSPTVTPDPATLVVDGAYGTVGTLEQVKLPNAAGLASLTARARATLAPRAPGTPGANPVFAGRDGPIKHVIYITRENKTYDAVLGDLHPGPGNALVLFGQTVTPNLHALERQFIESDDFNYQGFASVVGHMWEDTGGVSDVFERAIASDTGTHFTHGNDSWHDVTNYPATGLLTEQAHRAGLSVRTYNQELAQQSHLLPDSLQADTDVYPNYDLHIPDTRREAGWESEFRQFVAHRCTGELATAYGSDCALPDLEYVYLGEDHTTVTDEPGYPTIEAQVADNDLATGRLIDAVSHSPYWRSTAVIVVEDDPQGTGDSRSAYRGLLAIASPWVRRGLISHTPYDLTSAVGAIDRILGLPAITDYAFTSRPLDDLFTTTPDMRPFTADDSGSRLYPFEPLPGSSPVSDPAHGIYSFAEPDWTNPAVATAATWRAVRHTRPPVGIDGP